MTQRRPLMSPHWTMKLLRTLSSRHLLFVERISEESDVFDLLSRARNRVGIFRISGAQCWRWMCRKVKHWEKSTCSTLLGKQTVVPPPRFPGSSSFSANKKTTVFSWLAKAAFFSCMCKIVSALRKENYMPDKMRDAFFQEDIFLGTCVPTAMQGEKADAYIKFFVSIRLFTF